MPTHNPSPPTTPVLDLLDVFLNNLPSRLADALLRLGLIGQSGPPAPPAPPVQQPAQQGAQAPPAAQQPNPFLLGPQPPDPWSALGPLSRIAGAVGGPFAPLAGPLGRLQTIFTSVQQLADLFSGAQKRGRFTGPKPPSRKALSHAAQLARGRAPAPRFAGRGSGLPSAPKRIPGLQGGPPVPTPPPATATPPSPWPPFPPLAPGAPAAFPGAPPVTSQRRHARLDLSPLPPETGGLFGGKAVGGPGTPDQPVAPLAELAETMNELQESVGRLADATKAPRRGGDQRPFVEPVEGWPKVPGVGVDRPLRRGADGRPFVEPNDHDQGGAIAFARTLGTVLARVAELA